MKKVLIALMLVSVGSVAVATVQEDYRAAYAAYNKADYATANPMWEKLIADYPDTIQAAHAALNLAAPLIKSDPASAETLLKAAKKDYSQFYPVVARADLTLALIVVYADAQAGIVALNKVIADHPADVAACAGASRLLVSQYKQEKDLAGQEAVLKVWIDKYSKPDAAHQLVPQLVAAQIAQGKLSEANTTAFAYLTSHGKDATPDQLIGMFEKVSARAMSFDAYKTALQSVLLAVPASETNAVFLGLVKSELEKVK